ncbi:MAG: hypothetical protein RLT05_06790 [Bauldia litoralis]
MTAATYLSSLYGALGGIGVLLLIYGLGRVADKDRGDGVHRSGLWMIAGDLVFMAGSAILLMWAG